MDGRLMVTIGYVKNWKEFQHYKDRSPPWIKFHKGVLDDYEFACLPLASRALAPCIWLLASEQNDGSVRIDPEFVAFRLRWPIDEVKAGLKSLIDNGFINVASDALAECLKPAITEAYKEEVEKKEKSTASPKAQPARGCRLPDDWKPDDELTAWAKGQRPDLNVSQQIESFRDYWKSTPGAKGRKIDWAATFRNWIRNARAVNGKGKPTPADDYTPSFNPRDIR